MSVEIKFIGEQEPFSYTDGEGTVYRYRVEDSGALSIFEKEGKGYVPVDAGPIAVYGPAAWFSVSGDKFSKADRRPGRAFSV
ncbi:hypothetical protein KVH27_19555 [Streptomyces olivaceus]|uniref:hypothetical protein n=1 Tax=Streptomyces olivaceus TaxID=47716 RepID=UPI001CC927E6|nr:hypothetical protein [Streptomyces olivaceus]MBZ6250565.1 hypothetical protein [Streptomyces olivaceus]